MFLIAAHCLSARCGIHELSFLFAALSLGWLWAVAPPMAPPKGRQAAARKRKGRNEWSRKQRQVAQSIFHSGERLFPFFEWNEKKERKRWMKEWQASPQAVPRRGKAKATNKANQSTHFSKRKRSESWFEFALVDCARAFISSSLLHSLGQPARLFHKEKTNHSFNSSFQSMKLFEWKEELWNEWRD